MRAPLRWLQDGGAAYLTPGQRRTHTYVIGQPGTGKSRAIESWVMQDIVGGEGVAVVDPHGDLFHNLLMRVASRREVWDRVVLLDACSPKWTLSFNPLAPAAGLSSERLALFLTDVVTKIWKLDTSSSPRMIWLLSNSFLALSHLGLTLLDLPSFLLDTSFREGLLPRLTHEGARRYFLLEFPKSAAAIHQWVTPVLNKIGGLIFDPDLRLILAGNSRFNFREVLDRRLVLLVNLPKGIIGEGASALLGAFIVAQLQKAALSRANTARRRPFYLYLDEFQNYTTDNIKDILSESRKYALSLTLAHQYLDQLAGDLRSAVLNTAGTLVCFRVGYHDAIHLAKDLFPCPDFLATPETEMRLSQVDGWPLLSFDERRKPLGWDGLAQALAKLPPRVFWSRRRAANAPTKQRTLEMPDPALTARTRDRMLALLDLSGRTFGRLKCEVQQEMENRERRVNEPAADESVPLWAS